MQRSTVVVPEVILKSVHVLLCFLLLLESFIPDVWVLAGEGINLGKVQMLNGSPYVNLHHGIYFGRKVSSQSQRKPYHYHYHAFQGIRYASTPKRYEKSVPMSDLGMMSLPFLAQSVGSPCPQLDQADGSVVVGKEDCLFGDVFVPARDPDDKDGFPVIVFIHPGGFKSGSGGAFNVTYFMEEGNVICATFNFRLGALGFLSSNDEILPGNLGLHDQITFLKWIHDNINEFGGNKKRITVAGVESGGASVQFLLLSQRAKGLFQSAIIHGGSMLPSSFMSQFVAYPHSKQFSDGLECPYKPSSMLVECLKIKRLKDLMRSQRRVSENYFNFTSPFLPSFERCSQFPLCYDSFFAHSPAMLLAQRQFKRVPLLIGMNSIESMQEEENGNDHHHKCITSRSRRSWHSEIPLPPRSDFANRNNSNSSNSTTSSLFQTWLLEEVLMKIPGVPREQLLSSTSAPLLLEIQQLYFNFNSEESEKNEENALEIFLYDVLLRYGIWKFAVTYATDKPVYPYVISHGLGRCGSNGTLDHSHDRVHDTVKTSGETGNTITGFLPSGVEFLTPSLPDYHHFEKDSDEELFSRNLVQLWTQFATHQKPVDVWTNKETWLPLSASQLNGEKPLTWFSLKPEKVDIVVEERIFRRRMKFWNRIFRQKINSYSL